MDPFIAYCKQHMDQHSVKSRKTNYMAMISNFGQKVSTSNGNRHFMNNELKV